MDDKNNVLSQDLDVSKTTQRSYTTSGVPYSWLSIFFSLIHVKAWFSAPDVAVAPKTDLSILEKLQSYHNDREGERRNTNCNAICGCVRGAYCADIVRWSYFTTKKRTLVSAIILLEYAKSDEDNIETEDPPKRINLKSSKIPPLCNSQFNLFHETSLNKQWFSQCKPSRLERECINQIKYEESKKILQWSMMWLSNGSNSLRSLTAVTSHRRNN